MARKKAKTTTSLLKPSPVLVARYYRHSRSCERIRALEPGTFFQMRIFLHVFLRLIMLTWRNGEIRERQKISENMSYETLSWNCEYD